MLRSLKQEVESDAYRLPAKTTTSHDGMRENPEEQARISDLLGLVPSGQSILDIGARDGYLSCLLASSFEHVVALDLQKPEIEHERVVSVAGNVTALDFPDSSFDSVICAEVLEHIPPHLLQKACDEIVRVARHHVVIGVPYKQDTRIGRTTCAECGKTNPPWGHVNVFDESRLERLFNVTGLKRFSYCGMNDGKTNVISTALMDWGGNPYGTYQQGEGCVYCGATLVAPMKRNVLQKLLSKTALLIQRLQRPFVIPHANWIHMCISKTGTSADKLNSFLA